MVKFLELLNNYPNNGYTREYWLIEDDKGKIKSKMFYQHRRIWIQFISPIPKGYDIHHCKSHSKRCNELNKTKTARRVAIKYKGKVYIAFRCGNLMLLPKWLHSAAFHNIKDKRQVKP